jgi:hypothetical protein
MSDPRCLRVSTSKGRACRCSGCAGVIREGETCLVYDNEFVMPCDLLQFCLHCVAWALGEMVQQTKSQRPKDDGRFKPVEPVRLAKNGQPIAQRICCGRYIDQTHAENCPHRRGA